MTVAGQGGERVSAPTNITVVRTKSDLILIDTGSGSHFTSTAGELSQNMEAAGVDRRSITQVVYTHGHRDHLWGTLDDFDKEPNFPNANYVLSAAECNVCVSGDVLTRMRKIGTTLPPELLASFGGYGTKFAPSNLAKIS